jgi:hypothetical protein
MSEPYSVQIDGTTARDLAEKGGAFLFLDVPPGTYIGIDHQVRQHQNENIPQCLVDAQRPDDWSF